MLIDPRLTLTKYLYTYTKLYIETQYATVTSYHISKHMVDLSIEEKHTPKDLKRQGNQISKWKKGC
jgi:hypothetical protein